MKGFWAKKKPLVKSDLAFEAIWRFLLIHCEKKIKNNQKMYNQQKIFVLIDLLGFAPDKKSHAWSTHCWVTRYN